MQEEGVVDVVVGVGWEVLSVECGAGVDCVGVETHSVIWEGSMCEELPFVIWDR